MANIEHARIQSALTTLLDATSSLRKKLKTPQTACEAALACLLRNESRVQIFLKLVEQLDFGQLPKHIRQDDLCRELLLSLISSGPNS
ncbi:hypothetical protein AJ80_01987 [Polytolypa hystricis UAMH7299]|uniref:Uncharacterized protein n=1 Tax=Polytolypa hystricis (strain UAMH7299) TaxID=1447883 RepID=A0A2B7YRH9_POLH7|nr:hypothetical protein AJ80_01987 [Polytolypa hystricis UAMH7299]